ncbi:hypothetical protein F5X96DRAFT_615059 [Biscogniauxia mediterranea]|nr:hypothetical protein F5X96DRAFT_615059 [Biscogniauxia mediterranea]
MNDLYANSPPRTPEVLMESLSLNEPSRLDTLPTDVLLIILSYLDTARSFACLAATCRGLNQLVKASGWRIFVTTCFRSLSLPTVESDDGWRDLSQTLTSQSRDWERRAFVFRAMSPLERRRPHGREQRHVGLTQSIPGNIIVDAHARHEGKIEKELVVWGSGEDIVARFRQKHGVTVQAETWHSHKGIQSGYRAGKDDTTSISIVKGPNLGKDDSPRALVGRANGDLRLLSVGGDNFGDTLVRFHPPSTEKTAIEQKEIQALDHCDRTGILAAGTRENILLYPLGGRDNAYLGEPDENDDDDDDNDDHDDTDAQNTADGLLVKPLHSISLKDAPETMPFEFIRSVKFVNRDTIAISLNNSYKPIYYLNVTPTGLSISSPPPSVVTDAIDDHSSLQSGPRTVRALLPVDTSSCAGSSGNALLSSWDDGTIRLQDLRTPSAADRIYQDNFEVSTPTNALVSYGLERFVAGSARTHMVKIFDFRYHHQQQFSSGSVSSSPNRYFHTEALACGPDAPHPMPKPPTVVPPPAFLGDDTPRCDHARGIVCRWHVLARHDFYRPNCNVYLPVHEYRSNSNSNTSPVYSLARPSDVSPTLYAGLSGVLAEMTLKSGNSFTPPSFGRANASGVGAANGGRPARDAMYEVFGGWVAVLENGDGGAVDDVAKCQRVPQIRRQSIRRLGGVRRLPARGHRLDEWLQLPSELPLASLSPPPPPVVTNGGGSSSGGSSRIRVVSGGNGGSSSIAGDAAAA